MLFLAGYMHEAERKRQAPMIPGMERAAWCLRKYSSRVVSTRLSWAKRAFLCIVSPSSAE